MLGVLIAAQSGSPGADVFLGSFPPEDASRGSVPSARWRASAPIPRASSFTRAPGHPDAILGDNRTFSYFGSRLFLFDNNGKFVREWGQDVYGFNAAIGLRVDPQDNVWTIEWPRTRS